MTVARCLEKFKRDYAWSFRVQNTSFGGYCVKLGYTKEKDMYARRHAYKMLNIYNRGLSIRQLKNLYLRISCWLDEIIDLYA